VMEVQQYRSFTREVRWSGYLLVLLGMAVIVGWLTNSGYSEKCVSAWRESI
jgi:hypothetical protein